MFERYAGFNEYVKLYGLARSEGVLLRYLTQAYKAIVQSVPESYRDELLEEVIAFLRATLSRVDATLVREWETMVAVGQGGLPEDDAPDEPPPFDPAADARAFRSRLRAEMQALVKAIAAQDYEEAVLSLRPDPDDGWDAERLEAALEPFVAEHEAVVFGAAARHAHLLHVKPTGERIWLVQQTLVAEAGETTWMLEAEVDLTEVTEDTGPLVALRRIAE